ncbi:hypothetical protein [Enterovibrio nigricans]|nr:hypothetical protein [Enterovibrio nigricans]
MKYKIEIRLALLSALSFNAHSQISMDTQVSTNTDTSQRSSSPQIQRIIENAENPLGPVSIFDYHHYALNRKPFDNSEINFSNNSMGLSLRSVHPLFSENIAGVVKDYYDQGEKPPGVDTSVWQFFMNSDGMPSSYMPTVENDRMCLYFHRRYKLSDIAADASGALTNLGFVNSPDQWWFTVNVYNEETNNFDLPADDYVLRDHPNTTPNKFSKLAISKGAIQTQSNERWCFKYDEPAVITIKKGDSVIDESDFVWDSQNSNIVDIAVNSPLLSGYPHFTGTSEQSFDDANFFEKDKVQYVGVDLLRDMFYGLDSPSFDDISVDESIKNSSLSVFRQLWSRFANFTLPDSGSLEPEFDDILSAVISDPSLNEIQKFKVLQKKLNDITKKQLSKSMKNWFKGHYKGILHGNIGSLNAIKTFKNGIKVNGLSKTLSSIRIKNPLKVIKSYGPDSYLTLGISIWSLSESIRNPGNSTSEIVIAYIPGVSDGMTFFVDTSTKTNNFHALTKFNDKERTDYNTTEFPYEIMNKHMTSNLLGVDLNEEARSCFYADKENLEHPAFCLTADSEPQRPQSYLSFATVPVGYWVKAEIGSGTSPFYLTESMETIDNLSSYILPRGDVKLSLVKAETIQKSSDYCIYYSLLFKGVSQCYAGPIVFDQNRIFNDLSVAPQDSEIFDEKSKIKSYQKFSDRPFEIVINESKKSLFATSIPFDSESVLGQKIREIRSISYENALTYFADSAGNLNVRTWGSNDGAQIGDIYIYSNSYTHSVDFFRLKGDPTAFFPVNQHSNNAWEYIGIYSRGVYHEVPMIGDIFKYMNPESRSVELYKLVGNYNDNFSTIQDSNESWERLGLNKWVYNGKGRSGDIFIYLNPNNGDSEIFMLKHDGAYSFFPTDKSSNLEWLYIGEI